MRKPTFCICQNKDADLLRDNREADQRLCFRYTESAIPPLSKSEIFESLAIFCGCAAWFVSDQIGKQNVGFLMTRLIFGYEDRTNSVDPEAPGGAVLSGSAILSVTFEGFSLL